MKGLLPFILSLSSLHGQEPPIFHVEKSLSPSPEYEQFIQEVDRFNRELGGCPEKGSLTLCRTAEGKFNARLWQDIRRLASKVFHLPLPKE